MVIIDHISWLLYYYYYCIIIMYIAWLDNLRCLFFSSIRCARVKSELWTWTLRSLCPYHPRLFFNNYKVTVVIYLVYYWLFLTKLFPYIVNFCPYPYVTCHAICLFICHRNKRNLKLQNNLRPLARSETGNFLSMNTIPHSYISSFFDSINLMLS